jgi:hypothetical protein
MRSKRINNKIDYGTLCLSNQSFSDYIFEACGLSLKLDKRSVFDDCAFERIRVRKCSVGFPIFKHCRFENVIADRSGLLVYGAGFSECIFTGQLQNVVIGLMAEAVFADKPRAREFQNENMKLAKASKFAIDLTNATLENVGVCGDAIIPYVRCRRNQAVVLKADNLFEKLVKLGRAEENRAKSDFFLATGALPGSHVTIAPIDKAIIEFLPELEDKLRQSGIEITHFA